MSGKPRKRKIYITPYEPEDKDYAIYTDVENKLRNKGAEIVDILGNHSEWEIINNISKCQFIWLVTENSVREARCTIEVMTVLERAFRQNTINAVLLMHGNVKEQLLRLSVLDAMDKIPMKLKTDGKWQESQVDDILKALAKDNDVRSRFPAGNLSHGIAYSHFFGFHNVVLEHFEKKIRRSSWYQSHPDHFPLKIYELVPRSCPTSYSIAEKDNNIKSVGRLDKIEVERAGNKRRPYELPVYTLKDNDTDYFFVAQFPNAISAIAKMKEKKLAKMDDVDTMVQLTRYYYTMDRLLKHPRHKSYHDKVRLVLFNDEDERPYDVLLAAIKEDLEPQKQKPSEFRTFNANMVNPHPYNELKGSHHNSSIQRTNNDLQITDTVQKDVCIIHYQDCSKAAEEIYREIEQSGFKITELDTACTGSLSLEKAFDESRWIILILSGKALNDKKFFEPSWIASQVTTTKSAKVIPVLIDVKTEDIPDMLNWLLYLHIHPDKPKQFKHEINSLCNCIKGKNIEMTCLEDHLPAGDVGYGLAWGYAMNYLAVALEEFTSYIKKAFEREKIYVGTYSERLYIVVPKSCKAIGLLSQHKRVKHCFKLVTEGCPTEGTNIIKSLDIYSVYTEDKKEYYFVGQFPAAVTCLYEMLHIGIAGLKEDTMQRESENFCVTVQQILEQVVKDPVKASHCQFLHFDDNEPTGLADALVQKIEEDPTKQMIG